MRVSKIIDSLIRINLKRYLPHLLLIRDEIGGTPEEVLSKAIGLMSVLRQQSKASLANRSMLQNSASVYRDRFILDIRHSGNGHFWLCGAAKQEVENWLERMDCDTLRTIFVVPIAKMYSECISRHRKVRMSVNLVRALNEQKIPTDAWGKLLVEAICESFAVFVDNPGLDDGSAAIKLAIAEFDQVAFDRLQTIARLHNDSLSSALEGIIVNYCQQAQTRSKPD